MFGQQLDYVSSALKVLDNSCNNQYGIRGQPRFDKVSKKSLMAEWLEQASQ